MFDFISFVNRFDKLQFQMVLHKLHDIASAPGELPELRLAVEVHIGGNLAHPYFLKYTLPDLLYIRSKLRARGCNFNLVTLLRHPLLHHLSWHYHFCNHRVPLCFWSSPPNCLTRMAMGLTCHDGPHLPKLQQNHQTAVSFMWRHFDLVGITELFDEFAIKVADLVGFQTPAYRMQIVAQFTASRQQQTANWTRRRCASLLSDPPQDLLSLISKRMTGSADNARRHQLHNGGSSTGGPRGHMECRGYGPCLVPGAASPTVDMRYEDVPCKAVTPLQVLERICSRMAIDEELYLGSRKAFEDELERDRASLASKLERLQLAGRDLERRANLQTSQPVRELEAASGTKLNASYISSSGGGVAWKVNEYDKNYLAHERARYSCVGCSGDVVPEKDLLGCWPLWTQFAPDELRYRCNRTWTRDPGHDSPKAYRKGELPMPCWQTCWTPTAGGAGHCTPGCSSGGVSAAAWRAVWDKERDQFLAETEEGKEFVRVTKFVPAKPQEDFIYNVY